MSKVRRKGKRKKREKKGKKKRDLRFSSRSPANRLSKLVGARGKVSLRDKGYAWAPKSEFFIEVPKGKGFSYTSYFLPSGHVITILVQA